MHSSARAWKLAGLLGAGVLGLTGCSVSHASITARDDNTLGSHLGSALEEFPAIADGVYVLSLTQDVRLGSLPRPANQVAPTEAGWVIVGICADTATIDPQVTRNVILRVVSTAFIDEQDLMSIQAGQMQDGVVCGNAAAIGPDLDDS